MQLAFQAQWSLHRFGRVRPRPAKRVQEGPADKSGAAEVLALALAARPRPSTGSQFTSPKVTTMPRCQPAVLLVPPNAFPVTYKPVREPPHP